MVTVRAVSAPNLLCSGLLLHTHAAATLSPGAFNAAFCEIAGLAILIKPDLFDTVTERDYLAAMAEASLTVDEFVWLKVRRAAGPRTCNMLLLRPRLRLAAAAG